jgi:hypothetical protein
MTHEESGSGPYGVQITTGNGFGAREVSLRWFDDLDDAIEFYEKYHRGDGVDLRTCPREVQRTSRNRALREAMRNRKAAN